MSIYGCIHVLKRKILGSSAAHPGMWCMWLLMEWILERMSQCRGRLKFILALLFSGICDVLYSDEKKKADIRAMGLEENYLLK
jgi:hypothetical protein